MRVRDYKKEYLRRIASAEKRGLSRSQARGHAKASEGVLRTSSKPLDDDRIQLALSMLRHERSISRAAKAAKLSPERLRRFAIERDLIEKVRGRWRTNANLTRVMQTVSRGQVQSLKLPNLDAASKTGIFNNAVRHFLRTNRIAELQPFKGEGVRDANGKFHPFETNPNTLYRLGASGEAAFEQIYRIII